MRRAKAVRKPEKTAAHYSNRPSPEIMPPLPPTSLRPAPDGRFVPAWTQGRRAMHGEVYGKIRVRIESSSGFLTLCACPPGGPQ
jgi:hypothetical protein